MPHEMNDFSQLALPEKVQLLRQQFGNSSDLVTRDLPLGKSGQIQTAVAYMDGLVDSPSVNGIVDSLQRMLRRETRLPEEMAVTGWTSLLSKFPVSAGSVRGLNEWQAIEHALLSGDTVLFLDSIGECIAVGTGGGEQRAVGEPSTETVVRGPREGFSESLRTNVALVRRRIKDADLWVETKQIGRVTNTDVALAYINGIAQDSVVAEARARLERIDIDAILESGYIEEMIQDEARSLFPTMTSSERPDVIAAGLLEGRIAIFVDGTPFVLMAPVLFIQFFQAAEDYYNRYNFSMIRLLRLLSFFIAMLAPAFYIALTTFHQEAIPTPLLISLAAQREGIPFPAFVEAMIMEITFEILREAGVRMPRAIGQAVSIVGALVLGDAAVQAGLVSPAMVIVVSLTAISSFVIPAYDLAISTRIMRFIFMILAASFGLFGISAGIVALVLHLCSLRSFGVPILSPFAPLSAAGLKDSLIRFPLWRLHVRPRFLSPRNKVRERGSGPKKPMARK
ncbi:spore germination protein [Paenibacillus hemerocallicola]|uniref:Spore germination protein n=1 Tax=Paenibacillus hemerocallicola TaxID=1172614 RepID=A0A5C4SY25_9BACL|nr:spore germination protein [Paenibacillus hemerocallicola]TNJ60306.1 spore germination protein [Paenibacillus hemerocallicola]